VANAGVLLTRVVFIKETASRRFVITDAGMNDLIRPALYGAVHRVEPVEPRPGQAQPAEVVGPLCESGDFLARGRQLPPLERGDLLVVFSAGAYGMAMSSNYNQRPRAAEVLVEGDRFRLIRRRENRADLLRCELELF
jgi:diaminopimelate decarboxylase